MGVSGWRRRGRDGGFVGDRLAGAFVGVVTAIASLEVGAALLVTYPVLSLDTLVKSSHILRTMVTQWPFMFPLLPPEFQNVLEILR